MFLVPWEFNSKDTKDIPIPIKAGILAYEFVTIHPFWDENEFLSKPAIYYKNHCDYKASEVLIIAVIL